MRLWMLATAGLLLATPAYSAPWVIDKEASRLTFTGLQANQPFVGEFSSFTPVVEFDPANAEAGHIKVEIDMTSAHIKGDDEQNESLPTEDWFFVKSFPTATFESTAIHHLGGENFVAKGNLTLRGISKPLRLPFTVKTENGITTAEGQTTVQRNDYGLGGAQWKDDKWIAYPVNVRFLLLATPK